MSVVPNKPVQTDPYKTLGLSHDATPTQIKVTYRKLALQYHPDRQTPHADSGDRDENIDKEKTDKFVEIAAAYALLSDPARKKEYDHLYKFGAFDSNTDATHANVNTASMNYKYTENYSGGYYTKPTNDNATASSQQQHQAAPFYRSMSTASNDSFFDDLLHSPETKKNVFGEQAASATNNNRSRKPGIGFAFAPLGKHLSIHVPSRNEIVMGMARGERMHNFGTRVTFSTQKVEQDSDNIQRQCSPFLCAQSDASSKKFVSTTTRIAKGRHRVVKRTATLHPDGKKEVIVEEDGVVRRRYVEDICKDAGTSASSTQSEDVSEHTGQDNELKSSSSSEEGKENDGHWYSDLIRGVQGVGRLCFAPCAGPVLATVPEQDM